MQRRSLGEILFLILVSFLISLASTRDNTSSNATTSIRIKFWNDCASVVKSCSNSEWYAPHTLRIRIHGLIQYCLRRLRFLLITMLAAAIITYCKQTAVVTSESAILEMIDRSSEHRQIYRPTFNFSPTTNRPVFLRFRQPVNRPIYRLVGPLLKTHCLVFCFVSLFGLLCFCSSVCYS